MAFKNYYEILGVPSSANIDEIRESYRQLVAKYKDETNKGTEYSETMLKEVNEAIEVLANPDNRRKFDETLQLMDYNKTIINTHDNVSKTDAQRISDLTQKFFDNEKIISEKQQKLLEVRNIKHASYFSTVKVLFCLVIFGGAYYYFKPKAFDFLKGKDPAERRYYEWYTNDTTLIYSKPKKNAKVLFGVGKDKGFNMLEETTFYIKVNFIDQNNNSKIGYIEKVYLRKNDELVLPEP